MADLREQLRRIEATEPPDLWAEIESRTGEGRPRMDASIGSVVAFRKQGVDQRRRVAAGLLAAAVVALMVVVAWRAFRDASPEPLSTGTGTSVPDGWVRCTNTELGYSIGYPGEWHTTDVVMGEQDPSNACRWFSPTAFGPEGNVVSEGWGYPLEVATGGSIVEELLHLRVTEARVLEEEELSIDGRHAVRVEYETQLDPVAGPGLHYQYMIELDRNTTLIVHTTETRGIEGVYAENRTVVDLAVDTLIWLPARV
jgi:hypothetical protein